MGAVMAKVMGAASSTQMIGRGHLRAVANPEAVRDLHSQWLARRTPLLERRQRQGPASTLN
jgi:hypothetical protein